MSRSLPSRPSLEYLRKQARELLVGARVQHPSWQLADAQFALARDYGFASWPALKAHVDTLTSDGRSAPSTAVARPGGGPDDCPLTGSWRGNLEASVRHPALSFHGATLEVQVAGTLVTMTQVVVDETGKPSGSTLSFDADGEPHPVDGGGAKHHLVARWLDARTLEVVDRVDAQDAGRGHYVVSPDDRTLTVTTAEQRIVFDRR